MSAVVGVLQLSLLIRGSHSLKDKRRVLRSIKDRLRGRYNVSVAESDDHDVQNMATLVMAMAGNDREYVGSALGKIRDQLRMHPEAELVNHSLEIL